MNSLPTPTLTHTETAWLETAVPLFATIAFILLCALLLRGRLQTMLAGMLMYRTDSRERLAVEPALVWVAPIASEQQLLMICLVTLTGMITVLHNLAPLFLAVILAGPLTALIVWGLLWGLEQQYRNRLDMALPAAVGRLQAQLRGGSGFQIALEKVLEDMPAGPLHEEWSFFIRRLGTPLMGGMLATPQVICGALIAQTPSPRHATFLSHVEIALGQPHDVLVARVQAAYEALQHAEQRRSAANTELAQMRYSGIAISLVGLTMALYLFFTQQQRFQLAYQGLLGTAIGAVVMTALLLPLVGGFFLSQADDLDY